MIMFKKLCKDFIITSHLTLVQTERLKRHTCVYTQHIRINIDDRFKGFTSNYKWSIGSWNHFRLSVMSDEPRLVGGNILAAIDCVLCTDCVKNVAVRLAARRRESHPLFRLLSAALLSRPMFLIKLRHRMRRALNGLLSDCCSLIERMMYGRGPLCRSFLPISFGSVMLLYNALIFTEH